MTTAHGLVEEGELLLQQWLRIKPPPIYVPRQFHKPAGDENQEYWEGLVGELAGGHAGMMSLADSLRASDDATIGRLNARAYGPRLATVRLAAEKFAAALAAIPDPAEPLHLAAAEGRAYALVEASVGWARSIGPDFALDPRAQEFRAAFEASAYAAGLAESAKDNFRSHRALYNVGRVLQDLRGPLPRTREALRSSFTALEFLLAVEGEPDEPYWRERRADLLHRLILACALDQSWEAGPELLTYTQYLKDVEFARRVVMRADGHGRDIGNLVLKITALKGEHEIPLPLTFNMPQLSSRLPASTAVVEYVLLDQLVLVIFSHAAQGGVSQFKRDRRLAGALDVFLRPAEADFYGTTEEKLETEAPERIYALDMRRFVGGDSDAFLNWELRQDVLHVEPRPQGEWGARMDKQAVRLDPGVPWQSTLHRVLLEPLRERLPEHIEHLVIIPDMALTLLPFHLLTDSEGRPLHDRYRVSYAQNLAVLASSLSRRAEPEPDGPVLIVSDPSRTLTWADWEVEQVQKAVGKRAILLDRDRSTPESVLAAMKDVAAVHFCTHGFFNPDQPEQSGLLLAGGRWLTFRDIGDLEAAPSLVYLGACRTGRLRLSARFRSMGLPSQFLAAGARSVVSTLWPVADVAAALVAAEFYQNLYQVGMPRLESLTAAMNLVRGIGVPEVERRMGTGALEELEPKDRPFEEFFYWGPFALHGAWE